MFEKILKYYAGCITIIANRCSVFRYQEKEVHNMENYDYEKIVYQMLKRVQNQKIWKKIYTVLKVLLEQQED